MEGVLGLPPGQAALVVLVLAARVVPIFVLAPFFGARVLPVWARVGLGLGVTALLLPGLGARAVPELVGLPGAALVALAAKEAVIGVTLGLLAALPLVAAEAAGALVDETEGGGPGAALLGQLALVMFVTLDGHHAFLRGLVHGYEVVPPWRPLAAGAPEALLGAALAAGAHLFGVAVALAVPVLAARLLAGLALGVVMRATPGAGGSGGGAVASGRVLVSAGALLLALGAMVTLLRGELVVMLRQLVGVVASL